jgi:hypothetical protein
MWQGWLCGDSSPDPAPEWTTLKVRLKVSGGCGDQEGKPASSPNMSPLRILLKLSCLGGSRAESDLMNMIFSGLAKLQFAQKVYRICPRPQKGFSQQKR